MGIVRCFERWTHYSEGGASAHFTARRYAGAPVDSHSGSHSATAYARLAEVFALACGLVTREK